MLLSVLFSVKKHSTTGASACPFYVSDFILQLTKTPQRIQLPEMSGAHEGESPLARRTCRSTEGKPFPKKSSGILRKGNRLEAYRFIDEHRGLFGVRWLLQRLEIYPNAYSTESTNGHKKQSESRISCVKFKPYIMRPTASPDIAGCGFIWHARA